MQHPIARMSDRQKRPGCVELCMFRITAKFLARYLLSLSRCSVIMAEIFISYCRRDGSELARRLSKDLEKNGFRAWIDSKDLRAGERWTSQIEDALDKAEVVIALL